ncbi:hypothetical protein H6F93_01765 [Leptolyngbya sp. FACHB-671]|uniref:hypothetical protein n=1 Tax=Leptolyngbya sp. FACHB-671 TaxID=2692812 RepID=UPI001687D0AF|nr:hypothetical protein [Leptolyngbya sp. FACHB-671]MBD2066266.1 hypothetical protein [Leptolyngbya sp. FACHB-671]
MNSEAQDKTESSRENRSSQELFYTPCPSARSVAITRYPEMGTYQLPISLPLEDIQSLRDQLARDNWQLVDGEPADGAKILAATKRSIAGGAK